MGKRARLKRERKETRVQKIVKGEKSGTLDDLIDDIELLLRSMHNHVKHKIKLTVIAAKQGKLDNREGHEFVKTGISCDTCTAPKGCCSISTNALLCEGLPIARRLRKEQRDTYEFRKKLLRLGDLMESKTTDQWSDSKTPCVFLNEEDRCSIYNVRPSACRHHVVFSPPDKCSGGSDKLTIQFGTEEEIVTAYNWNIQMAESFFGFYKTKERGILLLGSLPKIVYRILKALDYKDYATAMRHQDWPTEGTINMS